jgi:hypothetical protein
MGKGEWKESWYGFGRGGPKFGLRKTEKKAGKKIGLEVHLLDLDSKPVPPEYKSTTMLLDMV